MPTAVFSQQQIVLQARFSPEDILELNKRRRESNRLGFAYQLAFVRLTHRFPVQQPLEVVDELLQFVSAQLNIAPIVIEQYRQRQPTIAEHRNLILTYTGLCRFTEKESSQVEEFLFAEALRLEQTGPLLVLVKDFLQRSGILFPADDTLRRLIIRQRQTAREHIFTRIIDSLSEQLRSELDALLVGGSNRLTPFQTLKQPVGKPSSAAMTLLGENLHYIERIGILQVDISWLNNNYQRSLTRYARRCSADIMRIIEPSHRYAVLTCFLWQLYRDTIDYMIDMYGKLITSLYNRAQHEIDEYGRKQRQMIRGSLTAFQTLASTILDDTISDAELRQILFSKIDRQRLSSHVVNVQTWLGGKYSHLFNLVVQRFSYLRQFAPVILKHLTIASEEGIQSDIIQAIEILRELNQDNKRKLPEAIPLNFIPKKLLPLIDNNGQISKRAWECALITAVRDELQAGNLYVQQSKRYGRFDDFLMSADQWTSYREQFFRQAGLPLRAEDVAAHFTERLNQAYDRFIEQIPQNTYISIKEENWQLSTDTPERFDAKTEQRLEALRAWLAEHIRQIKLPDLLIEVDNDLHFTRHFTIDAQQQSKQRKAESVCAILATIIAHGCNIGPYTMAQLTEGITYRQIKSITDWQLTEEAQRQALAEVVNAISNLQVSQNWGDGTTSSSDGQRFRLKRKVLQQTYSHRFRDYALEFYSFVADNYAPFYSTVIECTDRDAAYVLDGLLYNESDLALEEHYTDTHGYTEINFAAFAMLGRRFSPRIRGLHHQRIYRIDKDKDYGVLTPLVDRWDRTLKMEWISEQWDKMGQFYASLQSGNTTASTALKRLVAYSGSNHFYRANRELGRIFKTEYILQFMADPSLRQRVRRGLLKGEQMHALARQVAYGKQGRLTGRDLAAQQNTSSCLTLIMAAIIYWQAKEISRAIWENDPQADGVDLSLLQHISPIGWDNIILYGEYVLNQRLVRS